LVRKGAGLVAHLAADQMPGKEYILFLKMILYVPNGKIHQPSYVQKEERKKEVKAILKLVKRENLPRFHSSSSANSSFHFLCLSEKFELQIKII